MFDHLKKMRPPLVVLKHPRFATSNASVSTAEQDAQLVEKWAGYMEWVSIEPRIIGIFP